MLFPLSLIYILTCLIDIGEDIESLFIDLLIDYFTELTLPLLL